MDAKLRIGSYAAVSVAVLALLAMLLLPVTVESERTARARVMPSRVWTLEHAGRGELTGIERDHRLGVTRTYEVYSVDRGDVARLSLRNHVVVGARVQAGDTLGRLQSAVMARSLDERAALTAVAAAEIGTVTEGAKAELIQAAERRVSRVQALLDLQQGIVSRLETLQQSGVVALDELERARTEVIALEGELAVIGAELEVLRSGARPSERGLAAARLDEARRNLAALRLQNESMVVVSPLSGLVVRPQRDSVLVHIADLEERVAVVAVPPDAVVESGQELLLGSRACRVTDVDPLLSSAGFRAATCLSAGWSPDEPLGAVESVTLSSEPVLLRHWLLDTARSLLVGRR